MSISIRTIDSIRSNLSKAQAITHLLINDGVNNNGFESNHITIVTSIFAVSEFLQGIQTELDNSNV